MNKNNQSGITLLLAVFIVSAISLIAVSVSVLAIQSIRNSRAVVLSEPAIGAAHSGAEEGIWGIKRQNNCSASTDSTAQYTGTSDIWTGRMFGRSHAPATFTLDANVPFVFYLYDPCDPNGDLDLSGMPNSGGSTNGYQNMTVTSNTGSFNVNVYVTRLDGTPVGTPNSPVPVPPNSSRTITSLAGPQLGNPQDPDNRMQVTLIYREGCGGCVGDQATVTVDTDQGMPTYPTIDSIGCAQRSNTISSGACTAVEIFNRRIQVTVPQ